MRFLVRACFALLSQHAFAFCPNGGEALIVAGAYADARSSPNIDSEVAFRYKHLTKLTTHSGGRERCHGNFVLVDGTKGKRASATLGPVPDLWINLDELEFQARMKEWSGCWRISSLIFDDGVVQVSIDLREDGKGTITYSEPPAGPHPAQVFFSGSIVDIRDLVTKESYPFSTLLDGGGLKAKDIEILKIITRKC